MFLLSRLQYLPVCWLQYDCYGASTTSSATAGSSYCRPQLLELNIVACVCVCLSLSRHCVCFSVSRSLRRTSACYLLPIDPICQAVTLPHGLLPFVYRSFCFFIASLAFSGSTAGSLSNGACLFWHRFPPRVLKTLDHGMNLSSHSHKRQSSELPFAKASWLKDPFEQDAGS